MKTNILIAAAALLMASAPAASATTYIVTFDNVIIDNNPNYTITGSFLYDSTQLQNGTALYGLSDFNVHVVSPYGTFQMNTVWSVDSAFDSLGLGIGYSSNTPALMLIFSAHSNGNGTGLNNLDQAAANDLPLPLITNGQSDFIPGRSVLVPSVAELYGINSSGYGYGDWPAAYDAFPTVSGSLVTSAVPELSTWAMMVIGFACVGYLGFRQSRLRALPV